MYQKAFQKSTTKFIAAIMIVMLALAALPAKPAMAATITDTFTTSGTWTAPAGVTSVTVELWGGGGRGQSYSFSSGAGGGGGGGAFSSGDVTVVPGTGYTVVVGAGSSNTSPGGDSYFSTNTTVMAKGGSSSTSSTGAAGGAAASGYGSIKTSGGTGGTGSGSNAGGGGGSGGAGGNGGNGGAPTGGIAGAGSPAGAAGGAGRSGSSGNGTNGNAPGAGGGGAYRSSFGSATGGSGATGKVQITYSYPAPTIGTVAVSPDVNGYTSAAPAITAPVTSAVLPTCQYMTDGTTWVAGVISGSAPNYTCTGSPTGRTGSLTLNIQATNGSGTTTGTSIARTVDNTGPTDGALTVTPGSAQNVLSWIAATDSQIGLRATNTYDVRFLTGATPPATCSAGTSIYLGTALTTTHSGLTNGTQYSYRVCSYDAANNASTGATGTGTPASVPTLDSPTATTIAATTATLGANVTSTGGGSPFTRGMCWGINPNPSVPTNCTQSGTTAGVFTQAVTNLTAATKYYYRGYGTNPIGTGYSPEGSFYTEPLTQATNVNFTLVAGTTMTVNWTRGSGNGVIVLMKATSAVDSNPVDGTFTTYAANAAFGSGTQLGTGNYIVYKGTGTSVPVTSLMGGTTYYAAVYEYAGSVDTAGINQGTNYKLTPATGSATTIVVPPTATTDAATSVKATSAILHGTVNPNGNSTTVTFEYGLTTAYGTTVTADESPVTGVVATPVSFSIPGGLTPLTIYHFRVVAQVGVTTPVYGLDAQFTTAAVVPQTYYLNNTPGAGCSDSNSGLTPSAPFCTFDKATSVANAGVTISVLGGTYAETVQPSFSGGPGNLITFTAAPGVTITGLPGNSTNGGAFRLYGLGYIVIKGFTITGTADYGMRISYSNNITIENNHVSYSGSLTNNRTGIYLTGTTYSTITGNTTDHNYNDGIRLSGGSNYNTISNNTSYGNAVVDASQATGINLLGSSYNTVIHNTTYANEDSGLNFYTGSTHNTVVGNLSYGNGDHGIDNNGSAYNTVVGNTVHGNVTVGINFEEDGNGITSGNATIANNICFDNGLLKQVGGGTVTGSNPGNIRVDSLSTPGTTLDYDLVYNTTPGLTQIIFNGTPYMSMAEFKANYPGTQEVHGLEANPLFKSPAPVAQKPAGVPYNVAINLGDYHLLESSGTPPVFNPAIDSANSAATGQPSTDIEGNPRVDDLTVANTGAGTRLYDDRGAYEYQPLKAQTITITSTKPVAAVFGGPTYTPTATATSTLPVTITVDATASTVCSITAGVVSFIGVGNCVLDFNQAGDLLWSPAPQVQETFAVGKASQTITVTTPSPASAAYKASFTVAATASSTLPVTYSTTGVCTNVLGVFTMTSGTGTCTVHYTQVGDANYNPATEVTADVTASKIAQTITVNTHAPVSAGLNSSFTVAATSDSTLAVTYSASGVCSNVLGVFTMTSATGTCTVHYNQVGDDNYLLATEVTEPVTAAVGSQTITVNTHAPVSAIYKTSFTVAAAASSGLPVAYSATGDCTNLLGVFTMTSGTGTCTVHYNQAGNADYAAAPEVTETVTAAKAAQTITFAPPASPATYNTSFTVAPTSDSGLVVTVTPSGVCTITMPGYHITMTSGTGTCTLTASQSGDLNYLAATDVVRTVEAQKAAQAISIIAHVPPSAAYLSSFTVEANSNSGLAVAYSPTGVCTNIGATFTMTSSTGICTVHFNQLGDANYAAATEVTEDVTARALAQTITVTTHAPTTAVYLTNFTVAATASSGLPVEYSATGACTHLGNGVFKMTSNFGICYVHFNQFGNTSYAAAPEIIEQVGQGTLFMYLPFTVH